MLFALLLGSMLPAIALVVLDFLNDKVLDKKDVEKRTKVPVIDISTIMIVIVTFL